MVHRLEGRRQFTHPCGDLVGGTVAGRHGEDVRQIGDDAQHIEFAFVDEQFQIDLVERPSNNALLLRLPRQAIDPGVGVVNVEDGIVQGLRHERIEVNGLAGINRLEKKGQLGGVGPKLINEFS